MNIVKNALLFAGGAMLVCIVERRAVMKAVNESKSKVEKEV